jgi:hypothetical protein
MATPDISHDAMVT